METKIENFEQNNIFSKKNEIEEINPENAKDLEIQENSQIIEQSEFAYSCMSLPNEGKVSYDSGSVCASQAETLSQTSESSFFLPYKTPNSHIISSNEIPQIEKNPKKNIPFFHGITEYFQKIMPERFIDYTKTKNYLHKSAYLNKFNMTDTSSRRKNEENIPLLNYIYFPMVYCPINSFFFNQFPNVIINNNFNNTRSKMEIIKEIIRRKNEEKANKKREEEKSEDKKEEDKKAEVKEIEKDEENEEKNEEQIEEDKETVNTNIRYNTYNKQYNYKKEQYYHYKKYYYNNQRYNHNYSNKQYNKYSYYNDNDTYRGESYNYNNYYKRRYQRPFENKFYSYK